MVGSTLPGRSLARSRWTVGRLLTAGFALAVVALLALGASSYVQIIILANDRATITSTIEVRDLTNQLLSQLKDAETGQRGYVITGDRRYLGPYVASRSLVPQQLAQLSDLTRDDPLQYARVLRLRDPVEDKLAELASTVALRTEGGFPAAQALVLSGRGADDMDQIRIVVGEMRSEQNRELTDRMAASAVTTQRSEQIILWGSLLVAALVGAVAVWVTRKITGPVREVTATSRRISAGDMDALARVYGPVELAEMASAVNMAVETVGQARDEALAATRAKSAFLATMSHEIRTPMDAVIGMTGLLLDTPLDARQREYTETVRDGGEALLSVINDILDFSKIEAGDLELDSHPFELRECVESALALVALVADHKGLELVAHLDASCPSVVIGDVTRFRQVVVNLLSNAVKFTARGEVVVHVSAAPAGSDGAVGSTDLLAPDRADGGFLDRGSSDDHVLITLTVTDSGIGIPADRMDRLFLSFSQVDSSTTRNYGGTGLGLVISRRLARAMGGDLVVTSVAGTGSTFTFSSLLVVTAERRLEQLPRAGGLDGRSALIVDDNTTNRRVLRLLLEGWGMTTVETATGEEALALLKQRSDIDVAVLDMHMPGMDGLQLAAAVHDLPSRLPMILLSSLQWRPESPWAELFTATLAKPARSAVLREKLLLAVAPASVTLHSIETAGGRRRDDGPAVGTVSALRVLLAEDNPINQKVAQLVLSQLGYRVDTVSNGLEAIAAVRDISYDVVLMDVQMPELDGLSATRAIRAELPAGSQPHIVAMTASALVEDRDACLAAGMDEFLTKPIRPQQVAAVLGAVTPRAGRVPSVPRA